MNRLGDLIARLAAHQVEFVLVGGYAAVVYGASFVTRDVDICPALQLKAIRQAGGGHQS